MSVILKAREGAAAAICLLGGADWGEIADKTTCPPRGCIRFDSASTRRVEEEDGRPMIRCSITVPIEVEGKGDEARVGGIAGPRKVRTSCM